MVAKFLVDKQIESGRRLIETLDKQGVRVDAALWVYSPQSDGYRLVIGSGEVDTHGARPLYGKVQEALQCLPEDQRVPVSDIAVTGLSTSVVRTLSTAISTPSDTISSIRMTDNVVNRELIEDVYIYRMSVGKPRVGSNVGRVAE